MSTVTVLPWDRHRRVTELAQNGKFQVAVALALATAPPIARDRDGAADNGAEPPARATSSDQRSSRDKLAASSIFSGGIRRGSSFLTPPRNLGVGTKTVMPRRSAWARSGRCSESGLTLMALALFHGSMLKRAVRPPPRHPRNWGYGRAAETESAPHPQRQACPRPTAARRPCQRSPEP